MAKQWKKRRLVLLEEEDEEESEATTSYEANSIQEIGLKQFSEEHLRSSIEQQMTSFLKMVPSISLPQDALTVNLEDFAKISCFASLIPSKLQGRESPEGEVEMQASSHWSPIRDTKKGGIDNKELEREETPLPQVEETISIKERPKGWEEILQQIIFEATVRKDSKTLKQLLEGRPRFPTKTLPTSGEVPIDLTTSLSIRTPHLVTTTQGVGIWPPALLSLMSSDCRSQLRSVQEAQEHVELTDHANFFESIEVILNLVCSTCRKLCRSKSESDLHTKRIGHKEFTDKIVEVTKPIDLEVKNESLSNFSEVVVGEDVVMSQAKAMVVPKVNKGLLIELKSMGLPTVRALYFFGNNSIKVVVNWVVEHENDSDIEQMPMVSTSAKLEEAKPTLIPKEVKAKAKEL
eukprot:Gb_08173 [translate_table: standard]